MAENKKSFLIYSDTINNISHLTNEEKGLLFQHLLEYVNDLNPLLEDRLILTAWKPIETHLKRDLKKWSDKSQDRSDKARKAGLASAKARELKATKSNLLVENELKATKSTVNDSVNVNDNVIVEEKPSTSDLIKTTQQIKEIEVIYNTFINEIKEGYHSQWAESSYMSLKIKKGSLTPLLKDFKHQLIKMNKLHKNTLEVRQHFDNWLNKLDSIGKLNQYKTVKIGAL